MRYCLLNDCDNFQTIRPCCMDCEERDDCREKCRKTETTFCVGLIDLIEEKKDDG